MTRSLALLVVFLFCNAFTTHANDDFVFYTENYPPANFYKNGELQGISVDTLKLIWKEIGWEEQDIVMAPWARSYRNVLQQKNSALFTVSRTPAREPLFKWVGPLFSSVHVLMAPKSKNLEFENIGELFNYRVATIRGDISEISLQQIGYPDYNLAKVTDLPTAFKMMQSDRVDMMMVSMHGFKHLAKQMRFQASEYEQVWQVNKVGNYLAFNRETPDEVIKLFQSTLDGLEPQLNEIKAKYSLPLKEY